MHPIELFFSEHHPISQYVQADFSGSEGGRTRANMTAPEAFEAGMGKLVHTGFATMLLDSIMGGAVMGILEEVQPIATVGLSISHLRRLTSGEAIIATADCTGVFKDLAYVKGEIRNADGDVLAIASGTFMIGTRATSIRNRTEDSRI